MSSSPSLSVLCRFLQHLCPLSCGDIHAGNFFSKCGDGLFLPEFLTAVIPAFEPRGLNIRPRTNKTISENLEICLSEIWRRRGVLSANLICTAEELIESKNKKKIYKFISELFELFVLKEVRQGSEFLIDWANQFLSAFGWEVVGESHGIFEFFKSSVRFGLLLCLGGGVGLREFSAKIFARPISDEQFTSNAEFILKKMRDAKIPVFFDSRDFSVGGEGGNPDLLLLQLHAFWETVENGVIKMPDPHHPPSIAKVLGVVTGDGPGNSYSISEIELADMRFRDGGFVVREGKEDADEENNMRSPKLTKDPMPSIPPPVVSPTYRQRRTVPIMEIFDGVLFPPGSRQGLRTRMLARFLNSTKQYTLQFWDVQESKGTDSSSVNLFSEPFLVVDVRALLDAEPHSDNVVVGAVLVIFNSWGVIKDDLKMVSLNDANVSLRFKPDTPNKRVIVGALNDLKLRYGGPIKTETNFRF